MKKKVYLKGMCCQKCSTKIRKGLEQVSHIKNATIDGDTQTVVIESDQDLDETVLSEAIEKSGHYTVTKVENVKE